MSSESSAGVRTLFRHRSFLFYFASRGLSKFCFQIGAVAVGWQVYALTGSAFALGVVGLVQFIPTALLTFVAGHAADRYDRKRIAQLAQFAAALAAAYLAWGSLAGWLTVSAIFAAVAVFGTAIAFESPAMAAILPGVAPNGMLQRAAAFSTGAFQVATISGPALGGLIYALAPGAPYALMAGFWLLAAMLSGAITLDRPIAAKQPSTLASLFAGVGFVRRNPPILGSISLDLFAVLFGGATALLPIYARAFCIPDRGGLAFCAAPRRLVHWRWGWRSPATRSTIASACGCFRRSSSSASRLWCLPSHARCGYRLLRSPCLALPTW